MIGLQVPTGAGSGTPGAVSLPVGNDGNTKTDALLNGGFGNVFSRLLSEATGTAEAESTAFTKMLGLTSAELSELFGLTVSAEENIDWGSVLEQLAEILSGISPELLQQLEVQPEVQEWMNLVEAELAMSGEEILFTELIRTRTSDETGYQEADAVGDKDSKQPTMIDVISRLLAMLKANPESQLWRQVTEQGAKSILTALPAASTELAATASLLADEMQLLQAKDKGAKMPISELARVSHWLTGMNGNMELNVEPAAEHKANGNAPVSHMAAMEARSGFFRYIVAEANAKLSGVEAQVNNAAPAQSASGEATVQWNNIESMKVLTSEASTHAENVPQRVPISNLFEQLNQWMAKKTAGADQVRTEAVIRLVPEHLGSVNVKLSMINGQLTASITTESAMAREVLESNLAVLRTNLQNQGVTVERLTVTQQPAGDHVSSSFHDGRREQSSNRDSERQASSQTHESGDDWLDFLEIKSELEEEREAAVYGSSFQAQA